MPLHSYRLDFGVMPTGGVARDTAPAVIARHTADLLAIIAARPKRTAMGLLCGEMTPGGYRQRADFDGRSWRMSAVIPKATTPEALLREFYEYLAPHGWTVER